MKTLVLGGGVIGVTTAYYLRQAGHEVTLAERRAEVALETSFANGGQISWSAASPWAAPGMPLTALKWMWRRRSPFVLRPRLDPALWSWLFRTFAQCAPARYRANKERMLRLGRFSHECLVRLREETGIRYDERARGVLQIFRDRKGLANAARDLALLADLNIPHRMLDRAGCVALEPALAAARAEIAGGVHFPGDESGDCHRFTEALAERARQSGVRFEFATTVERLVAEGGRIARVETDRGAFTADAYVLACGSYSPRLLAPLRIRLPVYPVKGYSLTLAVTNDAGAPQGTLTDESHKVVITRLGNNLRAAGMAELAGYDLTLPPRRCAAAAHVLRDLFPGAGDVARAECWTGLRPMTPDNLPVLGDTPYPNLYLNTGHGTLGWTMACGSGKLLADLVARRHPALDLAGLTLARFRQGTL